MVLGRIALEEGIDAVFSSKLKAIVAHFVATSASIIVIMADVVGCKRVRFFVCQNELIESMALEAYLLPVVEPIMSFFLINETEALVEEVYFAFARGQRKQQNQGEQALSRVFHEENNTKRKANS